LFFDRYGVNSPEPLIHSEHLGTGPVIICDISVPSDVAPDVVQQRPDVVVIHGGIVRLPLNENFVIAGLPLEKATCTPAWLKLC